MTFEESMLARFDTARIAILLARVYEKFGVTLDELRSGDRHKNIAHARLVAYWLLRQRGLSFPEIGRVLNRDHTSVMYGVRKVDSERAKSIAVAVALEEMKGAAA